MKVVSMKILYFNQRCNVYMVIEDPLPKMDSVVPCIAGYDMHYGESNGIYSYGMWATNKDKRPGHGGFWSSRPSVLGALLGKELVEVVINGYAVAIEKELLESVLPEGYSVTANTFGDNKSKSKPRDDEEVVYEVHYDHPHANSDSLVMDSAISCSPAYALGRKED